MANGGSAMKLGGEGVCKLLMRECDSAGGAYELICVMTALL